MSDNTAILAIVAIVVLSLTTCSISDDWKQVEREKIQLERDKIVVPK